MAIKHGVYVGQQKTSVSTPVTAETGVPFVIGVAPVQSAEEAAAVNTPVLCTSWDDFVKAFGYSDDWDTYTLCEFAYSHFKLYGCQPIICVNVLDITSMKSAVTAADVAVADHKAKLPISAIDSEALVVKAEGGSGDAYIKGTDYVTYYDGENLVIELKSGTHYAETSLNIAYDKIVTTSIDADLIAEKLETIEGCMTAVGVIPDLICAPGFSHNSTVAAVMATKAESLNGVFKAHALIDVDCSTGHAVTYSGVATEKATANLVDPTQILCWPMLKLGEKKFHMSTALAGLIAYVDSLNGCPYESPSNKNFKMDALCLADGTTVNLTKAQADTVNGFGVVTALNFLASGWVAWGNYSACYPANTDVKDYLIPVSRMFDWVGNTIVKTFWSKLDQPMSRRLVDTILDTCNIWLNGLVGVGYLLGARAEMIDAENPITDLMAGKVKIHLYITPPAPAQEIDFTLEYDVSYVEAAFAG